MPFLRDVPIPKKLTRIITFTSTTALLIACIVFGIYEVLKFRSVLTRELISMADIIGANSTAALEFNDPDAGQETLSALSADSRIVSACIYTGDGKIFCDYHKDSSHIASFPTTPRENGIYLEKQRLILYRSIVLEGKEIGKICIQADFQEIYTRLYRYLLIALVVLLATTMIAYLLSSILQRLISKPIKNLSETARKVSESKDYSIRVSGKSNDEIGFLIDQFNNMLEHIQERDSTLFKELGERKRAEAALKYRSELERLIADISTSFINLPTQEIDDGIVTSLTRIGEFVEVDRCYIFILSEKQDMAELKYEWLREGIETSRDILTDVAIKDFKWGSKQISNFQAINIPSVNDLPDTATAEKRAFESRAIQSAIIVPMVYRERLKGFLGFDSIRMKRSWLPGDIALLKITGEIFVNALERKKIEEQIQNSLKEKEILLQEIHHRVKNNLQVIASLLYLQSSRIKDENTLAMFKDSQNRVRSMALVHESLYQYKDLAKVNFEQYIENLANTLFSSHGIDDKLIKLSVKVNNVSLKIDQAVPCGMIINELLSNSLKHAFPDARGGKIYVKFDVDSKERFRLIIKDNGMGFPADIDYRNTTTLGLRLEHPG